VLRGVLLALAPFVFLAARGAHDLSSASLLASGVVWTCAAACGLATALGGALFERARRRAALSATAGLAGAFVMAYPDWSASPIAALAWIVVQWGMILVLWQTRSWDEVLGRAAASTPARRGLRARGAALTVLAVWLAVVPGSFHAGPPAIGTMAASLAIAVALGAHWAVTAWRGAWPRVVALAGSLVLGIACALLVGFAPEPALTWAMVVPAMILLVVPRPRESDSEGGGQGLIDLLVSSPSRLVVVTFLGLVTVGSILLALPRCGAHSSSVGVLDASFTAVSAVCVTGLTVLDTPNAFSPLGLVVLVLLIQAGGLGIMTLSTAAMVMLGRRMSLRTESAMAALLSSDRADLARALRRILVLTFTVEGTGAFLLACAFLGEGDGMGMALWRGVFTAVSAFCNAGFAIQSDNLVTYQHNHVVIHVVGLLIIIGGLSPAAVVAVPAMLQRRRVAVQHWLAILTTLILLFGGAAAILLLEWNHSLAELSPAERLTNAWFHSVTPRTAGFNSVDMLALQPATVALTIVLMFIGGSPGGTAGGIKTTTAAVLYLTVMGAIRGRSHAEVFGRRLPAETISKATAIATIGAAIVTTATMALLMTQQMEPEVALFEVVSALGTVGLSVGGTPQLDQVGKILIMACMFAGRVGPLTLFLFLSSRSTTSPWELPEEPVDVG
jgi:trk system potassium uptake protein TrkH